MIPSPEKILDWAHLIIPKDKSDWLRAMQSELAVISKKTKRYSYALGGLKTAAYQAARNRKVLHYIMRICGAACLFMLCCYGIFSTANFDPEPKDIAAGQLITKLCLFYMCGAGLLILSLKGLKIFAAGGLSIGILTTLYLKIAAPHHSLLSQEFLMAVALEASILMIALFCASIYLNLLYTPDYDAA